MAQTFYVPTDAHIELKIHGSPERIELFHRIMRSVDTAWPYPTSTGWPYSGIQICPKCNGRLFRAPRVAPTDAKSAARQAGVQIKIKRWADVDACGKPVSYSFLSRVEWETNRRKNSVIVVGPTGVAATSTTPPTGPVRPPITVGALDAAIDEAITEAIAPVASPARTPAEIIAAAAGPNVPWNHPEDDDEPILVEGIGINPKDYIIN